MHTTTHALLALALAAMMLISTVAFIIPQSKFFAFAQTDVAPPTGTISINSDAPVTTCQSVTLALSCDDGGGTGCIEMKISMDGVFDAETFEAIASSKAVALPVGDGNKVVSVVFKDGAGNISTIFSDSIILDTAAPPISTISDQPSYPLPSSDKPAISGTVAANLLTEWGTFGTGDGEFDNPQGIVADSNIYVVDSNHHRVQKFDPFGAFVTKWGSFGELNFEILDATSTDGGDTFGAPVDVSNTDGDSERPYVTIDGGSEVHVAWQETTASTGASDIFYAKTTGGVFGGQDNISNGNGLSESPHLTISGNTAHIIWSSTKLDGQLTNPSSIAIDPSGNIYVTDSSDNRIQKFDASGNFLVKWRTAGALGSGFGSPEGIATDSSGNVYVADTSNFGIQKFDANGNFVAKWGTNGNSCSSCENDFLAPMDITTDTGGNVYVLDSTRILEFDGSGNFLSKFGMPSNEEVMYAKSTDGGNTFGAPADMSNNLGGSNTPDVLAAGDNLYLAWSDSATDASTTLASIQIVLRKSTDRGDTFGPTLVASNSFPNSASGASLAVSGRNVLAAWYEEQGGSDDAFYRKLSQFNNNAPVADAGATQTVDEGRLVTLNGSGTDPELDPLTYSWTQLDGPAVTLSSATAQAPTFTAPDILAASVLHFQLTVNDGILTATDTVQVSETDSKGDLTIKKVIVGMQTLLRGSAFTISPDTFTLAGSLTVSDNDSSDADPAVDGSILLHNVEFGTFSIVETTVPQGYARIVPEVIMSVHSTQQSPVVTIENKLAAAPVVQQIGVPSPDLTSVQFNSFILNGATIDNTPVTTVNDLPQGFLTSPDQAATTFPPAIKFATPAPSTSTAQQLISSYTIPQVFFAGAGPYNQQHLCNTANRDKPARVRRQIPGYSVDIADDSGHDALDGLAGPDRVWLGRGKKRGDKLCQSGCRHQRRFCV